MDRRTRYLHGIDRARQALAEWCRGELQWQVPRRVSEPRMVSFARRSEGTDRRMATPLQRGAPSFEPRLPHAQRVRDSRSKTSAPSCNGPGRCGTSGLRAPARCSTVPSGTNAAIRGSRLRLTVVRRIGAGQGRLVKKTPEEIADENARTNEVGLFNYADSYLCCAKHLNLSPSLHLRFDAPMHFLLFHAAELYLKSYLRQKGEDL